MPNELSYWIPQPYPIAILLAVVLGLLWLLALAAGWWRSAVAWLGLIIGAVLFPFSIAWVQVPLQSATGGGMQALLSPQWIEQNPLIASIPTVLESGLVQEAAKLLPLLIYVLVARPRGAQPLLRVGAAVGAGFGTFEAAWTFGLVIGAGWTLDTLRAVGVDALMPFFERLFAVGLHTATGVILAYGLMRGVAPLTYLLAAILHAITNYGVVLLQTSILGAWSTELYLAFWVLVTVGLALYLRGQAYWLRRI